MAILGLNGELLAPETGPGGEKLRPMPNIIEQPANHFRMLMGELEIIPVLPKRQFVGELMGLSNILLGTAIQIYQKRGATENGN